MTNGSYSERHFQTSAAVSDLFKIRYWRIRSEEPETLFLPAPDLFSMMHQKIGIFRDSKTLNIKKTPSSHNKFYICCFQLREANKLDLKGKNAII